MSHFSFFAGSFFRQSEHCQFWPSLTMKSRPHEWQVFQTGDELFVAASVLLDEHSSIAMIKTEQTNIADDRGRLRSSSRMSIRNARKFCLAYSESPVAARFAGAAILTHVSILDPMP